MAQQLSLLERVTVVGAAPVWAALDATQRAAAIRLLARVIAQTSQRPSPPAPPAAPEARDE